MYPDTIEYKDNVLTVKNRIFYNPEKNQFAVPVTFEVGVLREIDEETYKEWLKYPKLATIGAAETIKNIIRDITGISPYIEDVPDIKPNELEKADKLKVMFTFRIPETDFLLPGRDLINLFTLKSLAYAAEAIKEESESYHTSLDFTRLAIERGKKKLEELM